VLGFRIAITQSSKDAKVKNTVRIRTEIRRLSGRSYCEISHLTLVILRGGDCSKRSESPYVYPDELLLLLVLQYMKLDIGIEHFTLRSVTMALAWIRPNYQTTQTRICASSSNCLFKKLTSTSETPMTFRLPLSVQKANSVTFRTSSRGALKQGMDSDWLNLQLCRKFSDRAG
jgi:membrane-associated HD superfamily phosphohydrolase